MSYFSGISCTFPSVSSSYATKLFSFCLLFGLKTGSFCWMVSHGFLLILAQFYSGLLEFPYLWRAPLSNFFLLSTSIWFSSSCGGGILNVFIVMVLPPAFIVCFIIVLTLFLVVPKHIPSLSDVYGYCDSSITFLYLIC